MEAARDKASTKVFLFLDFDGVLHAIGYKKTKFEHVKSFENVVRPFVAAGLLSIVISSTWRKSMSLRQLRAKFSKDIASAIVGITPSISPEIVDTSTPEARERAISNPAHPMDGLREKEILSWIDKNAPGAPWLALDDDEQAFSKGCARLQRVPGNSGLTANTLTNLGLKLKSLSERSEISKLQVLEG